MKHLFIISIFILLALSIVSCNNNDAVPSDIGNIKITTSNLPSIVEQMSKDDGFSNTNKELFINAITRIGDEKDSIVDRTVAEIIELQKAFIKMRLNETLINAGARINLFVNHRFQYLGIKFDDTNSAKKINNLVFTIENTSDKEIKNMEGFLAFYMPDGSLVKVFDIITNRSMAKGSKIDTLAMSFEHNDSIQRDLIIRTSKDLSAVWTPIMIEFSDNTKIEDMVAKQSFGIK